MVDFFQGRVCHPRVRAPRARPTWRATCKLGGPTGTKFLSLICHTESKTRVPLTLAVVAARHPLLDGDTHQVLLLRNWYVVPRAASFCVVKDEFLPR